MSGRRHPAAAAIPNAADSARNFRRSTAAFGSSSAGNSASPRLSKTLAKPGNSGTDAGSLGFGGGIAGLGLAVATLAVRRRAHLQVLLDLPADLVGAPAGGWEPTQV